MGENIKQTNNIIVNNNTELMVQISKHVQMRDWPETVSAQQHAESMIDVCVRAMQIDENCAWLAVKKLLINGEKILKINDKSKQTRDENEYIELMYKFASLAAVDVWEEPDKFCQPIISTSKHDKLLKMIIKSLKI